VLAVKKILVFNQTLQDESRPGSLETP